MGGRRRGVSGLREIIVWPSGHLSSWLSGQLPDRSAELNLSRSISDFGTHLSVCLIGLCSTDAPAPFDLHFRGLMATD